MPDRFSRPAAAAPERVAAGLILLVVGCVLGYRFSSLSADSSFRPELPPYPEVTVEGETKPIAPPPAPPGLFRQGHLLLLPAREDPYVMILVSALYEHLAACPRVRWLDVRYTPLRGGAVPRMSSEAVMLILDHRDLLESGRGTVRRLQAQLQVRIVHPDGSKEGEVLFDQDVEIRGAASPMAWYQAAAEASTPVIAQALCPPGNVSEPLHE